MVTMTYLEAQIQKESKREKKRRRPKKQLPTNRCKAYVNQTEDGAVSTNLPYARDKSRKIRSGRQDDSKNRTGWREKGDTDLNRD